MSEILRENGPYRAKVTTDKYGVELQTTKGSGWWAGHAMSPELAKLTIEVLQEYLGNTREPQLPAKGEPMPQTIEAWQKLYDLAELAMLRQKEEISRLKQRIEKLERKLC